MEPEPRYFIVKVLMYGYRTNDGRWRNTLALRPGTIYAACHVGKSHLVLRNPEKPQEDLYLPLKSKWFWDRVVFAPELPGLEALFNPPVSA